jgi:serine/threonine protein phosphatase PrpC
MNINSAIVKGPNKGILQDAFGIINKQNFSIIVVADGLGSAKNSHFGAKKAVIAVEKAINSWRILKKKDLKVLIQLVHFYWNLLIGDSELDKSDCSTTCLFAFIDKIDEKIILAQLGDGLLLFQNNNEIVFLKSPDDYNYTKSLGSSKSFSDWNIKLIDINLYDFNLLICTDGISEDLVENKEFEFTKNLISELEKLKQSKRNKYLTELLDNWPTKFHSDDKTICIAWDKKK